MSDLISRQNAIDELSSRRVVGDGIHFWRGERNETIDMAVKIIQALPSVEPEIIKCKECRHSWFSGTATIRGKSCEIYKCNYWDDRVVSSNGYCWVAERRTDE